MQPSGQNRRQPERCSAGSNWAANAWNDSAQPCEPLLNSPEEPHEQSGPVCSVVHLATLEAACHAGGREYQEEASTDALIIMGDDGL
jgi:hypothetical protein